MYVPILVMVFPFPANVAINLLGFISSNLIVALVPVLAFDLNFSYSALTINSVLPYPV